MRQGLARYAPSLLAFGLMVAGPLGLAAATASKGCDLPPGFAVGHGNGNGNGNTGSGNGNFNSGNGNGNFNAGNGNGNFQRGNGHGNFDGNEAALACLLQQYARGEALHRS